MSAKKVSHYCLIYARDGHTFDTTNIGVIGYDHEGNQKCHRIAPLTRAKRRGDLPEGATTDMVEGLVEMVPTKERHAYVLTTTGHAMSCIQLGDLCATLRSPEETMNSIYEKMVKVE